MTTFAYCWTPYVLRAMVGTDPEMADCDNPRGEIYADRWHPMLEDNRGSRVISTPFNTEEECITDCTRRNDEKIAPASTDYPTWPCYGSDAFLDEGELHDGTFIAPTAADAFTNLTP